CYGRGDQGAVDLPSDRRRDPPERPGLRRLGFADDDRDAAVPSGPDRRIDGDLAEERDAEPLALTHRASVGEDLRPLAAVRTEEKRHVLDDPQDRDVDL